MIVTTVLVLVLALPFAGSAALRSADSPTATLDATIPASFFLKERPKDAKDLKVVKSSAKKGDSVVLVGRIGGRKDPFVAQRAVFLLVDPSLKACNENEDDQCKFPWDFCCESKETMKACMGSIQIVGSDGKPLKVTAKDAGGMKPLSKVTVVGTVADISKDGAFLVNATGLFVE